MIASTDILPLCFWADRDSSPDTCTASCPSQRNRITANTAISGQSEEYNLASQSCPVAGTIFEPEAEAVA